MTAGDGRAGASPTRCPLCAEHRTKPLPRPGARRFRRCSGCDLAFVERADLPDRLREAAHYRTHDNRPDDPRYRAFLARVVEPLSERLVAGMTVLDFGAGDGSPVGAMLRHRDIRVIEYDPLFRPDATALDRRYDAIVASEVIEHFHHPLAEFGRLDRLLLAGGWLGVMTEPLDDGVDFATWWYPRDPTHVAFYAPRTVRWIAGHFGWRHRPVRPTVTLFGKP